MAQNTFEYTIYHRRADGKPDFLYRSDSNVAVCLLPSVNICRGMLRYYKIRSALLSFAREFHRSQSAPWYQDPCHGFETLEDVVSAFADAIIQSFPPVSVDDGINNPGHLGSHFKQAWDGLFQPCDQNILINASRVRDMIAAVTRAEQTNDPDDCEHRRFRTFNFIFANTFLHEIGHVFVTFLTKGRMGTPRRLRAEVTGYSGQDRGEAGRYLETIIFGGTLEYYRDHADDNSQPGIPHILTKEGARRISWESINATTSCCFHAGHTPYRLEGPPIDPRRLENLGGNYPNSNVTNPTDWIIADRLKPSSQQTYIDPRSPIHRIPFFPTGTDASS